MGIPKSMLGPNLGLNTVEPPNTGMYWETWKIPSIQVLNLIFLDFEILNIKVRPPTVIIGKLQFLNSHMSG